MKVLFCTTEVLPFSRVGRLAEYSNAVPKALEKMGVEITLITPLYSGINREAAGLAPLDGHPYTDIRLGDENLDVYYHESKIPDSGIKVIFVECQAMFGRDGIYTNPADNKGFADNYKRFALFQEAVLHLIEVEAIEADLLHLNEYHTALIPAMLRSREHCRAFADLKTLLVIHNIAFQGDCDEEFAWTLGLSKRLFEPDGPYTLNGRLNFLKAGILFSDKVVTVSPTYADETRSIDKRGFGLNGELRRRGDDYLGIVNGINTDIWDPNTDEDIEANYRADRLNKREENKRELLARNGLDYSNLDIPAIGMITRFTDDKGFNLLTSSFDKLMTFDLTLIMLGTGEMKYHKLFESIQMRFPHKFGLNLSYSNRLARRILSGADFFLMPSRYEPCGQHQLIAMRYGAVPIGRAIGGFCDTVKNVSEDGSEGWGFTFSDYDQTELVKTFRRAVSIYNKKRKFRKIIQRCMAQDFSWNSTSGQYLDVYRQLVG